LIINDFNKFTKKFIELEKIYSKKSPVFLLGECTSSPCELSRFEHPNKRDLFEKVAKNTMETSVKKQIIIPHR